MLSKFLKNKKGSALPLVIIVAVLVTAAIGVMVNRMRMQEKRKKQIEAQSDFDVVFTMVDSILTSPSSCNATFYNGPHGASAYTTVPTSLLGAYDPLNDAVTPIPATHYIDLTEIRKCNDTFSCRPGTNGNNTSAKLRVAGDFSIANTLLTVLEERDALNNLIRKSENIRPYKLRVYKKQVQTGGPASPTILTVHLGLEKRMIGTNIGANSNTTRVVRKDKLIDIYVYLDSTLTRIAGCTKGAQSNVVYGAGYDWNVLTAWSTPCSGGTGTWNYGSWEPCLGATAAWSYTAWSGCSVSTCGYGTQTRSTISCNWNTNSGMQSRTANCVFTPDSGTQTRTVQCYDYTLGTPAAVADSYCIFPKPATTQTCTPADPAVCGPSTISQSCTPVSAPSCGAPWTSTACGPGTNCGYSCICNANQPAIWKASSVQGASCVSESTCGWCGIPGPIGPYWTSCTIINPY